MGRYLLRGGLHAGAVVNQRLGDQSESWVRPEEKGSRLAVDPHAVPSSLGRVLS